ncbi:hypothetical protein V6N13_098547 [Hibiscus sabdariffa]|uniref:Reverse transcriptase zinc-binding domain-containing protein n=1 Tax=Hibiscus sabdariffa TaxID=183260 RepID=A0ABR2EE54_9ROSI
MWSIFFRDNWLPKIGPLLLHCLNVTAISEQSVKVASIVTEGGEWDWSKFQHLLPCQILIRIAVIQCLRPLLKGDLAVWAGNKLGRFIVKLTYQVRSGIEAGTEEDVWSLIDRFRETQRMKVFLWIVCYDKIMTNQEHVHRHFSLDARCGICGGEVEDVDHVLRSCPQSQMVWRELVWPEYLPFFFSLDNKRWVRENLLNDGRFAKACADYDLMFEGTCWYIWLHRNARTFEVDEVEESSVLQRAQAWLVRAVTSAVVSRASEQMRMESAWGVVR